VWVEVSWGDVDGGEATGPLVVPLARSCISLALDVLSYRRAGASPRPSPPRAPRVGAHRATKDRCARRRSLERGPSK